MHRILITARASGAGKTTASIALITALKRRGYGVSAFKCGPDYIDPMFHRACGVPSHNLDPYFMDREGLVSHLAGLAGEFSVIEGVMGFTDGIAGTSEGSTSTVAGWTGTPVVFADAGRFTGQDGKFYGTLPRREEFALPSRRLGLVSAGELEGLGDVISRLGEAAEENLDMDGLIALAGRAQRLEPASPAGRAARTPVRIGVARDEAFCFMYEENLEMMASLGARIIPFSPLRDGSPPENLGGIYLCGGYPELHEERLRANTGMTAAVRAAVENRMPVIAECGGFMYLHYAGALEGEVFTRDRLTRFGYALITAKTDNMLCRAGESIRSHEFHYCDSTRCGDSFTAVKPVTGVSWDCVVSGPALYAGFPHLYFPANPDFAKNFVRAAALHAPALREDTIGENQ